MPRIRVDNLISTDLMEKMHEKALEILEKMGIKVTNQRLLKLIKGMRGINIENRNVRIKPELVEAFLDEYRVLVRKEDRQNLSNREEKTTFSIGYPGCTHIVDLDTDKLRPLTTEDVITSTKLIDALSDWGVRGGAPGAPQDTSPDIRRVLQCKIGYEYSRSASHAPFENHIEARYIREMAKALGREFVVDIYVVSPLRLEGISIDRAIPLLEQKACDKAFVYSMPLAGATAPIYPVGAFTQSIAENIGGYVILHTAFPEISLRFGPIEAFRFDMRHGNIVFGSPDRILMDLIGVALNRFYSSNKIHGVRSFRTMAKTIDIQAQVEKTASATVGILTGPGTFGFSGNLSLDEIFSPVQLIIDCEIGRYLSRLAEGMDYSEDDLEDSMKVIETCASKGTYLADKTTMNKHKRIYWVSRTV